MATDYVKFTGKAKWAKVYDADEFRGASNWSINLYLDEDELKKRAGAGLQSKVYEDEDGKYVTFKRPQTKVIKGENNLFAGPKVYDKDGKTLVEYKKNDAGTGFDRVGNPVLIGNGSIVTVTVAVYDTNGYGKGQRLESVRIDDLIIYEKTSGDFQSIPVTSTKPAGVKVPW